MEIEINNNNSSISSSRTSPSIPSNSNSLFNLNNNELWRYEKNSNTLMCKYWIRRKQRYCTHRVADGNTEGLCSDHSKEGFYFIV